MYAAIKRWLNIPIDLNKFIEEDFYGDNSYEAAVTIKCYKVDKITVVLDRNGKEVTSSTTVYLDGSQPIGYDDTLTIDGRTRPIQSLSYYYENGKVSIKVVNL